MTDQDKKGTSRYFEAVHHAIIRFGRLLFCVGLLLMSNLAR